VAIPADASLTSAQSIYFRCSATPPWASLYTAAGRTGTTPLAVYAAQGGTATAFVAASISQADVAAQLTAALANIKSCAFHLGGGPAIDLAQLAGAHVLIEGTEVPRGDADGWRMSSPTELDLVGTACAAWRASLDATISFQFPCSAVSVL